MKLKSLISLCMAGCAAAGFAQTHVDGEEYFKAGQYNNAYNLLERSLSNPSTDKAVSNYYLGSYWILGKDNAKARQHFEAGIAADPENSLNYVGLGKLLLMKGDVKGAEAQFKLAEKFAKKNPTVAVAIARAYYDVDPIAYDAKIQKLVEKAQKQNMQNPDIYIFLGDVERDNKNIGGAAGKYDMAKGYDPKSAVAYVKNAELYHKVNPSLAISSLKELLQNNPTSALGQHELAETYEEQGDYKNAAIEYGKYVNNPAHFKSDESKYAFLLYYDKQYKKGYDYATALLKEDPSNFDAQRYQFINAVNIPDIHDQVLPMAEALYASHKSDPKKKPLSFIDYFFIQSQLNSNGRYDEAAAILQEGIDNPNLEKFRPQLTTQQFQTFLTGAKTKMGAGFKEVQANNKEGADRLFAEGIDLAQKASKVDPASYEPVYLMGTLTSLSGNTTKGYELYEQAAAMLDASGVKGHEANAKLIYKMLGDYFTGLKQNDKAKNYYNKYLELDPENADINAAISKL